MGADCIRVRRLPSIPNWICRGPPDPSTGLLTSGVVEEQRNWPLDGSVTAGMGKSARFADAFSGSLRCSHLGHDVPRISLSDLSLPPKTVRKARCYTLEDMQKIVCSCDEPLSTICFILSVSGMRIGEVLALRVEDLDFRRKLLNVRCFTYAGQIGTPKSTARIADLPMPAALKVGRPLAEQAMLSSAVRICDSS